MPRRDFFQQRADRAFAPLGAGLFEQRLGLLVTGRLDFPVQDAPAKRGQQALFFAGGGEQHHHADIGRRKVLHQAREQLDLVVGQGGRIVHDPDLGGRHRRFGAHGVFDGIGLQHLVKAGDQRLGAGRKIHLQPDVGRGFAQAGYQQFAVVVQDGVVAADH